MTTARLLELWAAPPGYRLASVLATTYHLQVDFLEEDLLPLALGLRHAPARGREFRIELEQALQDVEVTIYVHPDGYQPGLRRSPRMDVILVPETRLAKLHAKVALLRFVPERNQHIGMQIVRLVTGSANLTVAGYRNNIEVAVAMDDAPDASPRTATAVRDAALWLRNALPPDTEQSKAQHRSMQAIFDARPIEPDRQGMQFVGLPRTGGLLATLSGLNLGQVHAVTAVSPFWPNGDDLDDVVSGLFTALGGPPERFRLIGPCQAVDGQMYAEMPPALLTSMRDRVKTIEVTYANPHHGCAPSDGRQDDEDGEYDTAQSTHPTPSTWRPLHAKILLIEGATASALAIGSFNFTRRGLGLHRSTANSEAGVVWRATAASSRMFQQVMGFSGPWRVVDDRLDEWVRAPQPITGDTGQQWPAFIHSIRADRNGLLVEGDAALWPQRLTITMRDIRSRLVQQDHNFDPWHIDRPAGGGQISLTLPFVASWLDGTRLPKLAQLAALADLDVTLEWDGQRTVLPVVFVDKHEFPVVELAEREDERRLLDWFLGLRPGTESEPAGFGHGFDPEPLASTPTTQETTGILSYLVRDFVHALPGIRTQLEQGAATETGLRSALLGPRSPARLADEVLGAWVNPVTGQPRKTEVATAFQLIELRAVVVGAALPELPDGMSEQLRSQCLERIDCAISRVVGDPGQIAEPALRQYLTAGKGNNHAPA
jgi:hypothetical protein